MRGVTYDYEFEKPDKTKLVFTGQTMPVLLANIKSLTMQHYGLDYKISRDTIYNVINRPSVGNKFFATKLKVKKNEKTIHTTTSHPNTEPITTQNINNTVPNAVVN
jgi:hypothetical protein